MGKIKNVIETDIADFKKMNTEDKIVFAGLTLIISTLTIGLASGMVLSAISTILK